MKYKILISKIEYGSVEIEADLEEKAIEEAYELAKTYTYNDRFSSVDSIDWYENEISDVTVDK